MGHETNLGAGTKLANLKFNKKNVHIKIGEDVIDTGTHKLGAILADRAQTGCNVVTNPGTCLSPERSLKPNTTGKGFI